MKGGEQKPGPHGVVDFLALDLPAPDLAAALRVVRAFKECESDDEWYLTSFHAWAKLEQLEEFLAHRVEGAPLKDDTVAAMKAAQKEKTP